MTNYKDKTNTAPSLWEQVRKLDQDLSVAQACSEKAATERQQTENALKCERQVSSHLRAELLAEKKRYPNVEFDSASMFHSLGIPVDLYTPIFAVSRISGWTAHVLEQYRNNRLIRPRAEYIGPAYPQTFLPLEQR